MADESIDKKPPRQRAAKKVAVTGNKPSKSELIKCGLVMPISPIDSYSESHWRDVRKILEEAARDAGFRLEMVSEAPDVGNINRRIIENLFDCEIVLCDLSGKNSNVMFELGVRFAFDKPAVIVKDSDTEFSFDVAPVEHIIYPRNLNYHRIGEFKADLSNKLRQTHIRSTAEGKEHSPFLESFGRIKAKRISTDELPISEFLTESIRRMGEKLETIQSAMGNSHFASAYALDVDENSPFMPFNSRALEAMTVSQRFVLLTKQIRAFVTMNPHLIELARKSAAEKTNVIAAIREAATQGHLRSPANWLADASVMAAIHNELTTVMM